MHLARLLIALVLALILTTAFSDAVAQRPMPIQQLFPGPELPLDQVATLTLSDGLVNGGVPKEGHLLKILPGPHVIGFRENLNDVLTTVNVKFEARAGRSYQATGGTVYDVSDGGNVDARIDTGLKRGGGDWGVFAQDVGGSFRSLAFGGMIQDPDSYADPRGKTYLPLTGATRLSFLKEQFGERAERPFWWLMYFSPLVRNEKGVPLSGQFIVLREAWTLDKKEKIMGADPRKPGGELFTLEGHDLWRRDKELLVVSDDRRGTPILKLTPDQSGPSGTVVRAIIEVLASRSLTQVDRVDLYFTNAQDGVLTGEIRGRDAKGEKQIIPIPASIQAK